VALNRLVFSVSSTWGDGRGDKQGRTVSAPCEEVSGKRADLSARETADRPVTEERKVAFSALILGLGEHLGRRAFSDSP